jgi:hypothetical protein
MNLKFYLRQNAELPAHTNLVLRLLFRFYVIGPMPVYSGVGFFVELSGNAIGSQIQTAQT